MEKIDIGFVDVKLDEHDLFGKVKVKVLVSYIVDKRGFDTFYDFEFDLDDLKQAILDSTQFLRVNVTRKVYDFNKIVKELSTYYKFVDLSASFSLRKQDIGRVRFSFDYLLVLPYDRSIVLKGTAYVG
jgi:hypothetical protein